MAELRNDVAHGNSGLNLVELTAAYEQAIHLGRQIVATDLGIA
jgi:hypothetical protein